MNAHTPSIFYDRNDYKSFSGGTNGAEPSQRYQDIRAYLFKSCASYQREILDARGITCFFDVDGGDLATWKCDTLAKILRARFIEICGEPAATAGNRRVTVSLRHKGLAWILAVVNEGSLNSNHQTTGCQSLSVQRLVLLLKGNCRTWLAADGAATVIVFNMPRRQINVSEAAMPVAAPLAITHCHEVPPLKWSILRYGFSKEDHDGEKETFGGRDRREVAAG